jgi:predicted methyltransferase
MTARLPLAAALVLALTACQGGPTSTRGDAPPPMAAEAPAPAAAPAADFAGRIDGILAGAQRSDANRSRDGFRNPKPTLAFFGVEPGMTVVEITPGGGWFTEILGPLVAGKGQLVAAVVDPATARSERAKEFFGGANQRLRDKLAADPASYGSVVVREFSIDAPVFGAPGSADVVLTFRNVHNWTGWGTDAAMFRAFFDVLKPGGVLGVEEHRAAPGKSLDEVKASGYLPVDYVVGLATAAGFVLEGSSEVNANPRDTRDHPNGVWNLPPTLNVREGDDRAKYQAIGESDRMTLRFVKPVGGSDSFEARGKG